MFGIATRHHPGFDGTIEGARLIYRRDYWAPIHGDELPPALALVVFDGSVDPGLGWASVALQRLVHVDHDGVVGPDTVAAAKHSSWLTVLQFTSARIAEFERLARIYPPKAKYLDGWRNRSLLAYRQAVKLEAAA